MKNLKQFASSEAIYQETLRSFNDWFIIWTSRGSEPRVVITYVKNRKPNTQAIQEYNATLEQLENNLEKEINNWGDRYVLSSLRKEILRYEGLISKESDTSRLQQAKVVVNEEDLPLFLRLIDQSGKLEVYEALKATGLRLNEFLNPTENPSCQGYVEYDYETGADKQYWTREYTWEKKEEE